MRAPFVGLLLLAGCSPPEPAALGPPAAAPPSPSAGAVTPATAVARAFPRDAIEGECSGSDCWKTPDGFRYLHPSPVGHTLESVVSVGRGEAIAVGAGASAVRLRRDGMTRITIPNVRTPAAALDEIAGGNSAAESPGIELQRFRFESVVRRAPDELFVLLEQEAMAHYSGESWRVGRPSGVRFGDRMFEGTEAVFVLPSIVTSIMGQPSLIVGDGDTYRSGPQLPKNTIARAGIARGSTIWLGADHGVVLVSRKGADFVSEPLDPPLQSDVVAIWVSKDESRGLLFGRNGEAYERYKGAWAGIDRIRTLEDDIVSEVEAIWAPPDETEIWVVGDHVARLRDEVWRSLPAPLAKAKEPFEIIEGRRYHAIDGTAPDDVWVVGRSGIAAHYDGKQWRSLTDVATDSELDSVVLLDKGRWLAVSRAGVAFEGDGASIVKVDRIEGTSFGPVMRAGDGSILIEVGRRLLQRRGDAWAEVHSLDFPFGPDAAAGPRDLVSIGFDGRIERLRGGRARKIAAPSPRDLTVAAFIDRELWVGADGQVLRGSPEGLRVVLTRDGDEYRAIAGTSPDDVWLVGTASTGGALAVHWDGKRFTRHESFQHHSLYGAAVDGAGGLYVVGTLGAMAHYDGKKWKNLDTGASRSLYGVVVTPDGAVVAVGDGGTIVARPGARSAAEP